jgi:hypothetical protein
MGVSALVLAPIAMQAATMNDEATEDLARAESLAREIRMDAGTVDTLTGFENETHQRYLVRIKRNATNFGEIVESLHENREDLQFWQTELVNRVLPKLEAMNTDIENALQRLNDNPQGHVGAMYEDQIDTVYSQADSIVNSINLYFEWAEGMEAAEQLSASN